MIDKELNFKHLLEKYADNPALIWPEGKLTYLQYFQQIIRVSNLLIKKGVKAGNRVAVLSDINHYFPILFFAILNVRGIIVPLNPKFTKKIINTLIKEIECDWLLSFDPSCFVEPANKIRILNGFTSLDLHLATNDTEEITSLPFTQEATIVFTSGSQGKPKGVLHTIENHYFSALGSNDNIPLDSNDCWMVSLPFFHIAGIAILFRTLISGAACYIPDQSQKLDDQLNQTKTTHLSLVSTQLYRWLEETILPESTSSLKAVLLGGSHISETLIDRVLKSNLPVHASYGSTEMSSQITTTSGDDLVITSHSSGKLLAYREIKIDKSGEILVRGKTLGIGYVSGKNLLPCTDEEGWFHSGDQGFMDENQNLIVTGRKDNMFISGGENIYPEEIERQLQFLNHIIDVCVVDIPDAEYGARPVAVVKIEGDEGINETTLKNYLRDKIAAFKLPVRFIAWPEELDSLKTDRMYLRELVKTKTRPQ